MKQQRLKTALALATLAFVSNSLVAAETKTKTTTNERTKVRVRASQRVQVRAEQRVGVRASKQIQGRVGSRVMKDTQRLPVKTETTIQQNKQQKIQAHKEVSGNLNSEH